MTSRFKDKNSFLTFFTFFICLSVLCQNDKKNYRQQVVDGDKYIEMVYIDGGTFLMGSEEGQWAASSEEYPRHKVQVSSFWMSQLEITWDLYNLFVSREIDKKSAVKDRGDEVHLSPDAVTGATKPYVDMSFGMGVQGYPAMCMTQLAAAKFCEWLSAVTGNYYRLPTEAEWEYACRAGSEDAYTFGNDLSNLVNHAWFAGNSEGKTHQVGQKEPNAWGLYDMHGNVAEWTLDAYDKEGYMVDGELSVDPVNMNDKTYSKSVRGGSWMSDPVALRSAARIASSKKWKMRDPQIPKSLWWHTDAPFVGFRIVRPMEIPSLEEQKLYWNLKNK